MRLSSQQVSEGQPRTTKLLVEPDAEVVQCHPRRQARSQAAQFVGTLPVKAEGAQELVVDRLHDLADEGHPPPETLGPASLAAVAPGRMDDPRPVASHRSLRGPRNPCRPRSIPRWSSHARKPRVRVVPGDEEGLDHRLVGEGSAGEAKPRYDTLRADGYDQPEALVPSQSVAPSNIGIASQPAIPRLGAWSPGQPSPRCQGFVGASVSPHHLRQEVQGHSPR